MDPRNGFSQTNSPATQDDYERYFWSGTNVDISALDVQNRVSIATPSCRTM